MNNILNVNEVINFQKNLDIATLKEVEPDYKNEDVWYFIKLNHQSNSILWHQEDLARRDDVDPIEIVKNKRTIDKFNQIRNNAIECMDEHILSKLLNVNIHKNAYQNSETAGSIIDRLSILTLKLNEVSRQLKRVDVNESHITECKTREDVLLKQKSDLASCLDELLCKCLSGLSYYRLYKQYKMYNDPDFNKYVKNE